MSPRVKMNMDEIPDAPENVPAGKYLAELVDCEDGESNEGKPKLVWQWEIAQGEHKGRTLYSHTSLQEHALFSLKENLKAFGCTGTVDVDTDQFLGKVAMLTVTNRTVRDRETGEKRTFSNVRRVEPAKKGGGEVPQDEGSPGKSDNNTQAEISDDDIPF